MPVQRQVRFNLRGQSANAGRAGECGATQQCCSLSDGVFAVDDSKNDQMPDVLEHGHAASVSVCRVW
ncbi:hypothetical protein BD311DRAFT_760139 [Dichomitus squalens]|uniref:Uncharacterized protein n=1 Tax=Dichomitus squalens TaxID=114155 RepID=A0A4Q9MLF8_9APHY|nr:hypothetical protein BD311DRAFT_760139 [Dichomitus squalens]